MDMIDSNEIKFIAMYHTYDEQFGYNIALGGGGRSVVTVSDETRDKVSIAQKKDQLPTGIRPYYKNNTLVGYTVSRKIDGIKFSKMFAKTINTTEHNYKLAYDYLESIKKGDYSVNSNKYNRKTNLPSGICYTKDQKGNINGYQVAVKINDKIHHTAFMSIYTSMEKKYKLAINQLNEWMKLRENNQRQSEKSA